MILADAGLKTVFGKANTLKKKLTKNVTAGAKEVGRLDSVLFKTVREISTLEEKRKTTSTALTDKRGFLKLDQGKLTNLDALIEEFTEKLELLS